MDGLTWFLLGMLVSALVSLVFLWGLELDRRKLWRMMAEYDEAHKRDFAEIAQILGMAICR